jgi:hypothetical protein
MKLAMDNSGKLIKACASAPEKALCPQCKGIVILRVRRRTNQPGDLTYFWRHENYSNPRCRARVRYDIYQ